MYSYKYWAGRSATYTYIVHSNTSRLATRSGNSKKKGKKSKEKKEHLDESKKIEKRKAQMAFAAFSKRRQANITQKERKY